jgi:hypothetical protein
MDRLRQLFGSVGEIESASALARAATGKAHPDGPNFRDDANFPGVRDAGATEFIRRMTESMARAAPRSNQTAVEGASQVAAIHALGDVSVQYGARILVIREMLIALTSAMSSAQREHINEFFQGRIEETLIASDNRGLSTAYYDALYSEIGIYLACLRITPKEGH